MNFLKQKSKFLLKIPYVTAIVLVVTIGVGVASSAFDLPIGIKLFTVQSGSMEPKITVGSLILVQQQENYNLNDVITFKSEAEKDNPKPKYTTTHRIIQIQDKDEAKLFITKGDANDVSDATQVKKDLVVGKTFLALPLIGYLVSYAKTTPGFIVFIVIPATILVYSELSNIKKEIQKILAQKKVKKEDAV